MRNDEKSSKIIKKAEVLNFRDKLPLRDPKIISLRYFIIISRIATHEIIKIYRSFQKSRKFQTENDHFLRKTSKNIKNHQKWPKVSYMAWPGSLYLMIPPCLWVQKGGHSGTWARRNDVKRKIRAWGGCAPSPPQIYKHFWWFLGLCARFVTRDDDDDDVMLMWSKLIIFRHR